MRQHFVVVEELGLTQETFNAGFSHFVLILHRLKLRSDLYFSLLTVSTHLCRSEHRFPLLILQGFHTQILHLLSLLLHVVAEESVISQPFI
jgi:hypothetical protein